MLKELTIEISRQCPNKCLHCSSRSSWDTVEFIDPELILAFAREAKTHGLCEINISGGEPLTHPNFCDIVSGLKNIGLRVVLYTTGISKQNEKLTANQFNSLSALPDKVIFSIFSHDQFVHDQITKTEGSHHQTVLALKNCIELGLVTEVHIVPMAENIVDIERTISWLLDLGVLKVSLLRLVRQGRADDNWKTIAPHASDWKGFCEWAFKADSLWGNRVRLGVPLAVHTGKKMSCHAGNEKLLVRSDGLVFPCEAFKDARISDFKIGKLGINTVEGILSNFKNKVENLYFNIGNTKEICPAQVFYQNRDYR